MPNPDCFDGNGKYPRVFVEWANGAFFTSEVEDFHALLLRHVAEFGPPTTVEYRDRYPVARPLPCDSCPHDKAPHCPPNCPAVE